MKIRYTRAAEAGLLAQLDWLAELAPEIARRAAQEIDDKLRLLADFPLAAPAVDERHREAVVNFGRHGFVVRYRIEGDLVLVVDVFHGRQSR